MVSVSAEELQSLIVKCLCRVNMPDKDAKIVAKVLVFADQRGVHSHGSLRTEHYCTRIAQGGINLFPSLKVHMLKPSIGIIDAEGAHGAVSMDKAITEAIKVAKKEGMAFFGVRNNSHCGALAYYVHKALEENLLSLIFGNTDTCVVPFGGRMPLLGTNPYAFGYPGEKDSIVLDMATSEVAFGKIFYAKEKNIPIPKTWAADREGKPVSDPGKAQYLFPFGGAKGNGINIMVEVLTGLLVGGVFGPEITKMYGDLDKQRNISNSIIVIDPSLFHGTDALKLGQQLIDSLHAIPPANGFEKVLVPGDIEQQNMKKSLKEGIKIPQSVYNYLSK